MVVDMKCFNPIPLPNPAATGIEDRNMSVSCGKCYACLSNRRRAWLFRLQCESSRSGRTLFLTLTYENEDRSYNGVLNKSHVKEFVDRLRDNFRFRYYFIGEYGTNTLRPHYHALLFFKDVVNVLKITDLITELWYHGYSSVSLATYRRLNYILHYHTRPKEPVPGLKTFCLYSNHLGDNFIYDIDGNFRSDIVNYLKSARVPVVQDFEGNSYIIPRYYRKKLQEAGLIPVNQRFEDISTRYQDYIRQYGKPYQVSEHFKTGILHDLQYISKKKLYKYNNQDKFI